MGLAVRPASASGTHSRDDFSLQREGMTQARLQLALVMPVLFRTPIGFYEVSWPAGHCTGPPTSCPRSTV
eukprot:8910936-Alexandrium_andersonii.AAC.1